ncbi:hypothetical protein N9E03_00650 [bacterium]|jgi:hypothetical protein|nr:hypothetical protein [bacterium]
MSDNKKETTSASTQYFRLMGYYNINDIKYDLLKIIAPYDGYMYNEVETNKLISVFNSYLGDLKRSYKIFSYEIADTEKENAITFDIQIKMQKDRSPKKLKIHVGKLWYEVNKAKEEGENA